MKRKTFVLLTLCCWKCLYFRSNIAHFFRDDFWITCTLIRDVLSFYYVLYSDSTFWFRSHLAVTQSEIILMYNFFKLIQIVKIIQLSAEAERENWCSVLIRWQLKNLCCRVAGQNSNSTLVSLSFNIYFNGILVSSVYQFHFLCNTGLWLVFHTLTMTHKKFGSWRVKILLGPVTHETSDRAAFSRSQFAVLGDPKSTEDHNNQDLWASHRRHNLV